jgi:predicted transcriptional regulator YheO
MSDLCYTGGMKNNEFTVLWKQYEPFIQAIVELFHPFAEAAVHDLQKGKIVALYHNISQRKIGDPSPLRELQVNIQDFPDFFFPYNKENWDGRPLKCTSVTMRNKKGEPIGLICINVDVSFFRDGAEILEAFLKIKRDASNPVEIFSAGCEEHVMKVIGQYIEEKNLSLSHLNRDQKRELVWQLYNKGVFNFKNAIPYVAKKLKTSRGSIYNYIKEQK